MMQEHLFMRVYISYKLCNVYVGLCYESHIGEVILRGRSYKDLGSFTSIASFWGVVLPRTYTHNK